MKLSLMIGAPDMLAEGGYVETPLGPFEETISRAARLDFDGVEILAAHRVAGDILSLRQALSRQHLALAGFNSGRLFFDEGLALLCGSSRHCADTQSAIYELIRWAASFSVHVN